MELARDEERVAVHLGEMIGIVDEAQILPDAERRDGGDDRVDEAEDPVRPPARQHVGDLAAHAAAGTLDRHARGIETRGFGEHVESHERRIDRMADQPAAREIGGRADRSARIHGDGEGRAVESRPDGDGPASRSARDAVDQRRDVAIAGVIGPVRTWGTMTAAPPPVEKETWSPASFR